MKATIKFLIVIFLGFFGVENVKGQEWERKYKFDGGPQGIYNVTQSPDESYYFSLFRITTLSNGLDDMGTVWGLVPKNGSYIDISSQKIDHIISLKDNSILVGTNGEVQKIQSNQKIWSLKYPLVSYFTELDNNKIGLINKNNEIICLDKMGNELWKNKINSIDTIHRVFENKNSQNYHLICSGKSLRWEYVLDSSGKIVEIYNLGNYVFSNNRQYFLKNDSILYSLQKGYEIICLKKGVLIKSKEIDLLKPKSNSSVSVLTFISDENHFYLLGEYKELDQTYPIVIYLDKNFEVEEYEIFTKKQGYEIWDCMVSKDKGIIFSGADNLGVSVIMKFTSIFQKSVQGKIIIDDNANCLKENSEKLKLNVTLRAITGNKSEIFASVHNGEFIFPINTDIDTGKCTLVFKKL